MSAAQMYLRGPSPHSRIRDELAFVRKEALAFTIYFVTFFCFSRKPLWTDLDVGGGRTGGEG